MFAQADSLKVLLKTNLKHALIYFSVSGIPQNKQAQIFNTFTQADANTTRKYGGTGLGLSICKRILENLNSKLQLESTFGNWATFYFTLNFELSRNTAIGKSAKTTSFENSMLMDIHMPEMDGIEAAIQIRRMADERKRNVPIIALTAENEMQLRQRVYEVGMNDYIFKPFNPAYLKERLGYALYNSNLLNSGIKS